jgi:hypothetical protein
MEPLSGILTCRLAWRNSESGIDDVSVLGFVPVG